MDKKSKLGAGSTAPELPNAFTNEDILIQALASARTRITQSGDAHEEQKAMIAIGDALRTERIRLGESKTDLATKLQISSHMLTRMENGLVEPVLFFDKLEEWARLLDSDASRLLNTVKETQLAIWQGTFTDSREAANLAHPEDEIDTSMPHTSGSARDLGKKHVK